MRSFFIVAVLGSAVCVGAVAAQSSSQQSTPERSNNDKRRPNTAMDALFENGPDRPHALKEAARESTARRMQEQKAAPAEAAPLKPAAPLVPTVQAVPPGPPQKNLTGEEFRLVRIGSTTKEVLGVLGPPSSRVVIPDDDGHLRETLQYWANGARLGTVRLDNGLVIEVERQPK
jgi:hypothetical protein